MDFGLTSLIRCLAPTIVLNGIGQQAINTPFITHYCIHILCSINSLLATPTGKFAYGFYDILQFPHDSNLTINSLLRVLVDMFSAGNPLPHVLYLQFHNCLHENKNKYLLSFCSLLVQKEVFQKVHVTNVFACILIQISYFIIKDVSL